MVYSLEWTTSVGMAEEESKNKMEFEEEDTRVKLPVRYLANCIFTFGNLILRRITQKSPGLSQTIT